MKQTVTPNYFFPTMAIFTFGLLAMWPLPLLAESAPDADTLIVYSGRAERLIKPVLEAFTTKTGIHVELLTSKTTALINRLSLEADRTPADILITNDAGGLEQARKRGLLQSLNANPHDIQTTSASDRATHPVGTVLQKIKTAIPATYRANDNSWTGLSGRIYIVVYNTQLLPTPNPAYPEPNRTCQDVVFAVFPSPTHQPRTPGELWRHCWTDTRNRFAGCFPVSTASSSRVRCQGSGMPAG